MFYWWTPRKDSLGCNQSESRSNQLLPKLIFWVFQSLPPQNVLLFTNVLHGLGSGRPSAGGPRWDRRSNTLTHGSLPACGAQLGGIVWKQGKWQNPLNLPNFLKVSRNRRNSKIPWIREVSGNRRNDKIPWNNDFSTDFVVSPVSRHFPYSRGFVISPVSRQFHRAERRRREARRV